MENLGLSPSFWKGRRVLVTGHTGFKGGWLSLWLQRLGADVAGYALDPPTEPSLFEAASIADGMLSVTADVRDLDRFRACLAEFQAEVVIHMAAQSLVRRSYADPVGTYATNVMGTVHLFQAARASDSVRVVLNVTSDKCYENREWPWGYREIDPMGGYDPYSSSKACAELVTAAFRNSFLGSRTSSRAAGPMAVASARAGNVIGGGDWAEDRLVPDIMRAFMSGQTPVIRNPSAIRPWQHVLEPLLGYLLLVQRLHDEDGLSFAEAWNFGPHDEDTRPVAHVADRLSELWGSSARWDLDSAGSKPHEAHCLKLDCSKAAARLAWRPRLALDEALAWTVEWYRRYHLGDDVRELMTQQIADYERHAELP